MPKLRKALPNLSLMLYEYQTESLLKRLRDGEIDLGIMALPTAQEGIESRELYEEDFTVALPNNHPLGAKSTIKVQDLKGHTLLLLEDGHCLRDQALEVCSRVDVREAEDFRATSLETLRQMVVAGLGITLLPELAVESPFGSQRGLTIRRFTKPAPSRTVGAVWRKSSTRAPGHRRRVRRRGPRHVAASPMKPRPADGKARGRQHADPPARSVKNADWAFHADDEQVLDALAGGRHAASLREYFGAPAYAELSVLAAAAKKFRRRARRKRCALTAS